jgi:hypothetical protein
VSVEREASGFEVIDPCFLHEVDTNFVSREIDGEECAGFTSDAHPKAVPLTESFGRNIGRVAGDWLEAREGVFRASLEDRDRLPSKGRERPSISPACWHGHVVAHDQRPSRHGLQILFPRSDFYVGDERDRDDSEQAHNDERKKDVVHEFPHDGFKSALLIYPENRRFVNGLSQRWIILLIINLLSAEVPKVLSGRFCMDNAFPNARQMISLWAASAWLLAMPFDAWQRSATLTVFVGVAFVQSPFGSVILSDYGASMFRQGRVIVEAVQTVRGWIDRRRVEQLRTLTLKELQRKLEERESFLAMAQFTDYLCDRTTDVEILRTIPPVNNSVLRSVQQEICEIRQEIRRIVSLGPYRDSGIVPPS